MVLQDALGQGDLLTNINVNTSNRYYQKKDEQMQATAPLRNRKAAFIIQKSDFLGVSPEVNKCPKSPYSQYSKQIKKSSEDDFCFNQRARTPHLGVSARKRSCFSSQEEELTQSKRKRKSSQSMCKHRRSQSEFNSHEDTSLIS